MGTYIGPPVFNSGAGGDTIPPSRCLTCYGRVTSKGYPAVGTYTTVQYHFYNATCPHRCIHESLLAFYQLGNYYGRYTAVAMPIAAGEAPLRGSEEEEEGFIFGKMGEG